MTICFYNSLTKEKVFESERNIVRIPVKGDYIRLSKFASTQNDADKYKGIYEVSAVILDNNKAFICIDLNKEMDLYISYFE